jgi:sugar lactone lactonase YvrE
MSATETLKATRVTGGKAATGRLFFLDLAEGRILSVNPDGSDKKVIVTDCPMPDGIVVDSEAGHIYWTNMGAFKKNNGSIERADLDGLNRKKIIPDGGTFTPKQLHLEKNARKLYWCDREGMRVMRANLDGSNIETLIDSSKGDTRPGADQTKWCVGIAVDSDRSQIYWTQKGPDDAGEGRLFRAKIDIPRGETAANRTDIELLFDGLPEPIDLEIDRKNRFLYWTDRGDAPKGNTVNRASLDADFSKRLTPDILLTHLMEAIGIALDFKGNRMFLTDLTGTIYSAKLDGTEKKPLLMVQGNLTGIAYAEVS